MIYSVELKENEMGFLQVLGTKICPSVRLSVESHMWSLMPC